MPIFLLQVAVPVIFQAWLQAVVDAPWASNAERPIGPEPPEPSDLEALRPATPRR